MPVMYKILFHLNCLEQGGAERVVSNLANQFAREGHEVLVTTQWQGENEFQLDEKVRRLHVGLRKEDRKKSRITQMWLRVKYLRACIQKEQPDITIAFAHKANYRALMATLGMRMPVIISVRTDPVGHYDAWLDKLQIALLFPRAAGCVFQTEGQREFFPEYLQKRSRIILNPVHDKYLQPLPLAQKTKTIVQSGRLVDFKNQPMLLQAFLQVHEKYPEYDLKIYGPDSFDGTKEILEKIICENHAEEFIHLMGGSDKLEQELPKAEIYAFSSDWEGLPNALLEAMALGMPIVATDCPCGGPRTVMTDGVNGLLVPIKDPNALAAGIIRLIEDTKLAAQLGENAKKIREKVYGPAITGQWQDYIREVIEEYKDKNRKLMK